MAAVLDNYIINIQVTRNRKENIQFSAPFFPNFSPQSNGKQQQQYKTLPLLHGGAKAKSRRRAEFTLTGQTVK